MCVQFVETQFAIVGAQDAWAYFNGCLTHLATAPKCIGSFLRASVSRTWKIDSCALSRERSKKKQRGGGAERGGLRESKQKGRKEGRNEKEREWGGKTKKEKRDRRNEGAEDEKAKEGGNETRERDGENKNNEKQKKKRRNKERDREQTTQNMHRFWVKLPNRLWYWGGGGKRETKTERG